jgi:hypothetical protein
MVCQMAGRGITITLHAHQARARNARQHFDIAIKRESAWASNRPALVRV